MIKNLRFTKRRKLLAATIICVALITGTTMLWQMGQVAEAAILDPHPGLVGWWRFDEGSGGVAEDSSGFGNTGVLEPDYPINSPTWVDGKHGKALSFDGSGYVEAPNSASLSVVSSNHSVFSWIKGGAFTNYNNHIMGKFRSITEGGFLFRVRSNGRLNVQLFGGGGIVANLQSNGYLSTGIWYHVGYTLSGTTLTMYVDGVEDGSTTISASPNDNEEVLRVGIPTHSPAETFNGTIDDVRIYSRALSQAEVFEVFQKVPDFSSKLLAKIPKGTTQVIVTASWQGIGSLNATIDSPSESYTEDMVPVYQKTSYSTSGGTLEMLNIKRLSISIPALSSDENWYITLDYNDVEEYTITVEIQK